MICREPKCYGHMSYDVKTSIYTCDLNNTHILTEEQIFTMVPKH